MEYQNLRNDVYNNMVLYLYTLCTWKYATQLQSRKSDFFTFILIYFLSHECQSPNDKQGIPVNPSQSLSRPIEFRECREAGPGGTERAMRH